MISFEVYLMKYENWIRYEVNEEKGNVVNVVLKVGLMVGTIHSLEWSSRKN